MSKKNRTSVKNLASLASVLSPDSPEVIAATEEVEAAYLVAGENVTDAAEVSVPASEYSDGPITDADILATFSPRPVPAPPVKAPAFSVIGVRDSFGYGSDTETSFLLRSIRTGTFTRKSLAVAFLARFTDGSEAEAKRKKTSFSVFFSDVKRPIGYYHASRALPIRTEETAGLLSFDPERVAKVETAISAGILSDLKGLTAKRTPAKYSDVLSRYGVNFDPSEFLPKA